MADTGLKVAANLKENLLWLRGLFMLGSTETAIKSAVEASSPRDGITGKASTSTCSSIREHKQTSRLMRIIQGFRALNEQGQAEKLEIHPSRGFSCERASTPLSFFATEQVTPVRISDQREANTGIGTETSSEILVKKVKARMIRNPRDLLRDAYDFVVAHVEEPLAIEQVFQALSLEEKRILAYDAQSQAIQLADAERILSPAYPGVLDSLRNLTRFARQALATELTDQSILEIEHMRRDI